MRRTAALITGSCMRRWEWRRRRRFCRGRQRKREVQNENWKIGKWRMQMGMEIDGDESHSLLSTFGSNWVSRGFVCIAMGIGVIIHGFIESPGSANSTETKRVYRANRSIIRDLPLSD